MEVNWSNAKQQSLSLHLYRMQTVFHFVIEDTTRQFSTTTSATLKISDKISSPMENIYIYIHISRGDLRQRKYDRRNIEAKYFLTFLSPLLFSIPDLYFFFTNDEWRPNEITSPPSEKPLLFFLVLLFILILIKIERVALLSSENKNKISYLSVEWITTTTTILRASHVSFSSFRIELLRNASLGFFELHRQISDTLVIRHVGNWRLLT